MRLLSAGALWWLLLSAVIIFFYLLKLKRSRRVVPSVFLWQRALEEMEANAPFKKLRRSLLLLLQLLALLALVFALARPLVNMRSLSSGNSILIIDSTASMSTRDESGRSRLDRAKELAREMISGLGSDDRAAIIESSSRLTVRSPLTSDRAALSSAIGMVEETDASGNLSDALQLAEQIAKSERDATIVVIGDGGGSAPAGVAGPAASNPLASANAPAIRFVRVGQRADNVGIVAMNSRPARAPAGGNVGREMFASLANFSDQDRAVDLELRLDGKLIDARGLNVGPNDRSAVIFNSLPPAGGLAELRLKVDDDLDSDNVAYTLLPDARRLRVGVSAENLFLLQALAVNSEIDAIRMSSGSPAGEFDLIVGEGQPAAGLFESNRPLLLINPPDAAGVLQAGGNIERPEVTQFDARHPVNGFLNYADLHIESAPKREAAGWLKPIAGSASDPLIWAGDDGRRRVVAVGFDLAKSDLPLKVEFPILLANSLAWLSGRDALASERAVRTGQTVSIPLPAPAEAGGGESGNAVTVRLPGGDERELPRGDGPAVFADTMRVGAYEVSGAPPFAASLLSESESDNAPRDTIQTRSGEASGQQETFNSEREAWRWVALLALAVLSIEWWVYHRRITA
ncbi:MAG TPA: VWA domain-containing protein [Blastocatellia bacterium]|nr:VWA domain-containing protein [Blastocatellia bacterium]